jgi:hypothetical protein
MEGYLNCRPVLIARSVVAYHTRSERDSEEWIGIREGIKMRDIVQSGQVK